MNRGWATVVVVAWIAGVGLWTESAVAQARESVEARSGPGAVDVPDDFVDTDEAAPDARRGPRAGTQDMEWVDGQWVPAASRDFATPDGLLAWIRHYADRNQNALVVSTAGRFLKEYPGDPRSEEVMLLAGEAEMRRERYWQAFKWFEKQLDAFAAGEFSARTLQREHEVAEAFLSGKPRIVLGFLPLPARSEGIDIMLRIVERAPGSALAEKSMMRVADFYFDRQNYLLAVGAYDRYQELFKSSPRIPYAMYRAALAALGMFRDTSRDETPLIDAEQRFTLFARRFPRDAQAAEAGKILETIRDLRGQTSFETGEYYRKVGRAEAAAFYYERTVDRFSDTAWGERAAARRAALGDVQRKRPTGVAIPAPGLPVTAAKTATERIEELP